MRKTNWKLMFLGGLVTGIVLNVFYFAITAIFYETNEFRASRIVFYFITGVQAVWLYSSLRPRYGTGSQTAVIAGLFTGALCGLTYFVFEISASVLALYTTVAMYIVATLAGAWIYRE